MQIKTGLESSDKFIRRVLLMIPKKSVVDWGSFLVGRNV
jgi:hypothetical protein